MPRPATAFGPHESENGSANGSGSGARICTASVVPGFRGSRLPATILLVDDDQPFLDMLRAVFEDAGLRVRSALNVSDGLRLAADHRIDGALTDYELPQFDGLHFCREFRRQTVAAGRPLPVWVMTGSIALTAEAARAAGAEGIFRKPFSALDVTREIQKRLLSSLPLNATGIESAGCAKAES